LAAYVRRRGVRRVLIVADADEAGLRGSERLRAALRVPAVVWTPPCKDLREFVRAGGSAAVIQSATRDLMWGGMR
jgi:DNA primase